VAAVLASSPWGILGAQFTPYLMAYPANTAAAVAACWADWAGQLLDFEARHPESVLRVRCEDLAGDPAAAWRAISAFTGITPASPVPAPAGDEPPGGGPAGPDAGFPAGPETSFPAGLLPPLLIQRINLLHDRLNYPPVSATAAAPRGLAGPPDRANGSPATLPLAGTR
jgi:hypothetical protein